MHPQEPQLLQLCNYFLELFSLILVDNTPNL